MSETQENESQRKARDHKAKVKQWQEYAKAMKSRKPTDFEKNWQKHLEPQLISTGIKYAMWLERGHAVTCDLTGVRGGDQDSALERSIEMANQWSYVEREIVSEHGGNALTCLKMSVQCGATPTQLAMGNLVSVSRADVRMVLSREESFGERLRDTRIKYAVRLVENCLRTADDIWTDAGKDRYVGPKVARGDMESY